MGIFKKVLAAIGPEATDKFMVDRQEAYDRGQWELRSSEQQLSDFHASYTIFDTDKELIRIGGSGDGGYLIPDDLVGVSAVFSPGVAAVADFEKHFADRGIKCFLADASVKSPPIQHENFEFVSKFVHSGPTSGDWVNFQSWVGENSKIGEDLILQMDIEGGEWEILDSATPELLRRFRIVVLELHGMHQLAYKLAFQTIDRVFRKLTNEFEIVHIHPNNAERALNAYNFDLAPLLEVTLLRKDRIHTKKAVSILPRQLDRDNVKTYPTTYLDDRWFVHKS